MGIKAKMLNFPALAKYRFVLKQNYIFISFLKCGHSVTSKLCMHAQVSGAFYWQLLMSQWYALLCISTYCLWVAGFKNPRRRTWRGKEKVSATCHVHTAKLRTGKTIMHIFLSSNNLTSAAHSFLCVFLNPCDKQIIQMYFPTQQL